MKVFTRFPGLAPAIQEAGYEPCLLEPLELPPGRVEMLRRGDVLVVTSGESVGFRTLLFEKSDEVHGWRMVR